MFREKYRRDNELIKAPSEIPEAIKNMAKEKSKYTRLTRTVAAAVACAVVAAAVMLPFAARNRQAPVPIDDSPAGFDSVLAASDYSEIYAAIEEMRENVENGFVDGFYFGDIMVDFEVSEAEPEEEMIIKEDSDPTQAYNSAEQSADDDYSSTNTQVEGVDEGDIIKTDGKYIYRLANNEVVIIDAQGMRVVSRVQPFEHSAPEAITFTTENGTVSTRSGWVREIYIAGDRLVIVYAEEVPTEDEWRYDTFTGVMVYDISDPSAPELIGDVKQSGHIVSTRMVGEHIYLVTSYGVYGETDIDRPETFVPVFVTNEDCRPIEAGHICVMPEANSAYYTVIASVNIENAAQIDSTQAVLGYCGTVYADTQTVLLAFSNRDSKTVETQENGENVTIVTSEDYTDLLSYDIKDGKITQGAQGAVPGSLLNQFSIDRYDGVVRVVTTLNRSVEKIFTDGIDRHEYDSSTTNGLYTLNEKLNIIGKLDGLAEDERVYSVRFMGETVYFVTFRQVDPLFAVDLSDPENPKMLSALKIPGFSQYMHPYADGLLFGLGMDADEETGATNGLKLSMFDISDPANVTERHKLIMEDIWWSEALYDHKAIVISAERNIIAFPSDRGYLIYGYGEDGFYERFELESEEWKYYDARGLFISDSFYISTPDMLCRYDISEFKLISQLEINE